MVSTHIVLECLRSRPLHWKLLTVSPGHPLSGQTKVRYLETQEDYNKKEEEEEEEDSPLLSHHLR